MKNRSIRMGLTLAAVVISACSNSENDTVDTTPDYDTQSHNSESHDAMNHEKPSAAQTLDTLTEEQRQIMNKTPITPDRYPEPPSPHFGPEYGSIRFVDQDPGPTIGGTLTMKPAVNDSGIRLNEADAGITMYMIHWGLEVGEPGVQDDKGAGDLGGDCMGFRDTGHVVMKPASDAGDKMSWEIPMGTVVPKDAVYFVGHTLYGKIHNLGKCTQTPINNRID